MTEVYDMLKAGIADATDGASYFKAGREFQRNRDADLVRSLKYRGAHHRNRGLEEAASIIEAEDKS